MAAPLLHPAKKLYAYSEYLELEKETGLRHEYWEGQVFAMAGEKWAHNRIASNTFRVLDDFFSPTGCKVAFENFKQEIEKDAYYVYPDIIVSCDKMDLQDEYKIRSPLVLVEVLSPSTENYDRTTKWDRYSRLPSLRYYLLVSQTAYRVELYSRQSSNMLFSWQVFTDLSDAVPIGLDLKIPMKEIYKYIDFSPMTETTAV